MSRQPILRAENAGRPKNVRRAMQERIHAEFPKLRPGLRHSREELRQARLDFCREVLGRKTVLASMNRLTEKELGRVIEAIKAELKDRSASAAVHTWFVSRCGAEQMGRPADQPATDDEPLATGQIIHLAGPEQAWAIERVFEYLQYDGKKRGEFLESKFHRKSVATLSPAQANSALMILFTIAASRDLRGEAETKISRSQIARHIPTLKVKLGIGLSASEGQI